MNKSSNGILLPKLFWPTVRKNCSCDRKRLLKFEAEGWEFEFFFRGHLNNLFAQWKISTSFETESFINWSWRYFRSNAITKLEFKLEKNNWDLKLNVLLQLKLTHIFARTILLMKKLEIEKTKSTFIISVLKVEY